MAKPKPAPAKSPGAKSAGAKQPSGSSGAGSARPKASGRNKRVAELDVEAGTAMPTKAFRLGADNHPAPEVVLSRDDEESLAKFTEQVNSFLELRADAAEDDTAFAAWSKDKLQQISVVKTQINNKKKSLNRRCNKDGNLAPALDELVCTLGKIVDFVRKLSAGTAEGRRLFDVTVEIQDLKVCTTIWKRILKAVAFDALKLAQWDVFFTETHNLCVKHVADHAVFFQILASQLLQRLLKAIPMGKPITGETTSYIKAFVLVAIEHSSKTQSIGWTADDHLDFLKSIRDVTDFSTPPTVVNNAIARLKADEGGDGGEKHWAASSFQLPQGKKLFEAAKANATHKESQAGVLDVLHHTEERLANSALCTFDAPFMTTVREWFNESHGDLVSESLKSLTDKKMKVLKGADKDKLERVIQMARNGAVAIILAFVNNEMVPYMNTWTSELRDKKPSVESMMPSSSCIMHLADASGHGQEALIGMLKDISAFIVSASEKIGSSDSTAESLSTLPTTWAVKTKAMIASLVACTTSAEVGEAATDLVDRVKSAVTDAGSGLSKVLQDGVQDNAWASVQLCVSCLSEVVTKGTAGKELLTGEFPGAVESAKLYSTILEEDVGKKVLAGVEAVSILVTAMVSQTSLDQLTAAGDADEQTVELQSHELIRSTRKLDELTLEKLTTSVSELGIIGEALSPDTLSKVGSICQQLIERGQHEFASVTTRCTDLLSKSFIAESDVEIPDFVQQLESYDQLDGEKIKAAFDLTVANNITSLTTELGSAIDTVKELAASLEVDASKIVELTRFETAYRSGIRWMGTCNILYLLISKAVSRAVLAGSKPSAKALGQFQDALKVCTDERVELCAGLQAVVTKVCNLQ